MNPRLLLASIMLILVSVSASAMFVAPNDAVAGDLDGDGVDDSVDHCRDVAGSESLHGCPAGLRVSSGAYITFGNSVKYAVVPGMYIRVFNSHDPSCALSLIAGGGDYEDVIALCDPVAFTTTDLNGDVLIGVSPGDYLVIGADGTEQTLVANARGVSRDIIVNIPLLKGFSNNQDALTGNVVFSGFAIAEPGPKPATSEVGVALVLLAVVGGLIIPVVWKHGLFQAGK